MNHYHMAHLIREAFRMNAVGVRKQHRAREQGWPLGKPSQHWAGPATPETSVWQGLAEL